MLILSRAIWLLSGLLLAADVMALPIGFGRPPAGQDYEETKSKNFYIYHDKRAKHEAKLMLNSLESVRPVMERWFDKKRGDTPLPVIMSATTSNASFANFITDALEIQTLGQGSRDLAWHEYTHAMTYEHFENLLGPAGSILHLMWLPSWYLEGLAEALASSIGSDEMASIERYYALTDTWPTYDRLHSLYSDPSFSYQGYAVSGALVSYMLRKLDHGKVLPEFLSYYQSKSMPWYWPYSILPFSKSMPLENSLHKFHKISGPDLYKQYKQAAKKHWKRTKVGPMYTAKKGSRGTYGLTSSLQVRGDQIYKISKEGSDYSETILEFEDGWAVSTKTVKELPDEIDSTGRAMTPEWEAFGFDEETVTGHHFLQIRTRRSNDADLHTIIERNGYVREIMLSEKYLIWEEQAQENTRICRIDRALLNNKKAVKDEAIKCPFQFKQPHSLSVIGTQLKENGEVERVWLTVERQTKRGDGYKIIDWLPDADKHSEIKLKNGGRPISASFQAGDVWVLIGERDRRSVRKLGDSGQCEGAFAFGDLATAVHAMPDGSLVMPLFRGSDRVVVRVPKSEVVLGPCKDVAEHTSPLLAAMNRPRKVKSLTQAARASSLWREPKAGEIKFLRKRVASTPKLDRDKVKGTGTEDKSQDHNWRGRPVFAVPWLGADAGGLQMGILSIPLMDHMQNEEIRLYLAYGINSNFPHSEISFRSTRFWPALQVDAFRYQTWNGEYYKVTDPVDPDNPDADGDGEEDEEEGFFANAFVDERGVRVSTDTFFHSWATTLRLGIKFSHIRNYIGFSGTRQGRLNEPFITLTKTTNFGKLAWANTASAKAAPEDINESYEYNQLGLGTRFAYPFAFLSSVLSLGVEGSRTRGKRPRELQEVYRPLKIFVPGSGGGFNNLSFPLLGVGGLFSARFGSNQFRSSTSYSFPIIRRVDKVVRLLYFEELTFTGFLNYGGAWYGDWEPEDGDLIAAHGYNLDLHFDVKGFNFHIGQGWGQVFGSGLQTYLTFSFDAIF